MATYTPPKQPERISEASTPELFAGVIHDARELAVGHLDRMRHEIKGELGNLKTMMRNIAIAVGMMVIGAVLGGHFIAIVLIALGVPTWVSYGVTAAIAIVAGLIVMKRLPDGKDSDLVPEDSLAGLGEDLRDVARAVRK